MESQELIGKLICEFVYRHVNSLRRSWLPMNPLEEAREEARLRKHYIYCCDKLRERLHVRFPNRIVMRHMKIPYKRYYKLKARVYWEETHWDSQFYNEFYSLISSYELPFIRKSSKDEWALNIKPVDYKAQRAVKERDIYWYEHYGKLLASMGEELCPENLKKRRITWAGIFYD